MDYPSEFESIIQSTTALLGRKIDMNRVEIIDRGQPHTPQSLKPGTMGVYTFIYRGEFLKIGKAGPNSNNRFLYQHYHPGSAKSTLADSLLSDLDMKSHRLTEDTVGNWIKNHCRRIDILLDASLGVFTLELIESILHYKYSPKYEGFSSQR